MKFSFFLPYGNALDHASSEEEEEEARMRAADERALLARHAAAQALARKAAAIAPGNTSVFVSGEDGGQSEQLEQLEQLVASSRLSSRQSSVGLPQSLWHLRESWRRRPPQRLLVLLSRTGI